MEPRFNFKAKVWLWNAQKGSWHFLQVPKELSEQIKGFYEGPRRGFGSVRVVATIGSSEWKTSVFPDKKSGCYVMPLKADIRKKEKIEANDTVEVDLKLE